MLFYFLGSWPAGIDTSYPKKAIYPGVLAFYKELDLGTAGSDFWENSRLGNLVFLSARPHVYKDYSEYITYQKSQWLQETRGLHTSPSLLAGMFILFVSIFLYFVCLCLLSSFFILLFVDVIFHSFCSLVFLSNFNFSKSCIS